MLDKAKVTLKESSAADHVVVISEATSHAKVDESIERKGIQRNVKLTVPYSYFVAVGHILSRSDMIATVPERYARECVKPFRLK